VAGGCLHWHLSMCLSSTARLFVYLRQNSQKNNFGNRAYSWGNGLEYHVSTSYRPNTIAAGFRGALPDAFDVLMHNDCSFSSLLTVSRALSRASLMRSTSFCVTPGGKVWGTTGSSVKWRKMITSVNWIRLATCAF